MKDIETEWMWKSKKGRKLLSGDPPKHRALVWVKEQDGRITWAMDEEIMRELGRGHETERKDKGGATGEEEDPPMKGTGKG